MLNPESNSMRIQACSLNSNCRLVTRFLGGLLIAGIMAGNGAALLAQQAPAGQLPPPAVPEAAEFRRQSGDLKVQIRDITTIQGYRSNSLTGAGLVTGLNGTGDSSAGTQQAATNILKHSTNLNIVSKSKNISLVMVSAELPPFVRSGETIDVLVSVMDNAKDLKGGVLYKTPLEGPDGQVYAVAEGPLVTGGFSVSGDAGSVSKNHPTVGYVRARVEKEVCMDALTAHGTINLLLRDKSALTASRVAGAVNLFFPDSARAVDNGTIEVFVPDHFRPRLTDFIAMIGGLTVAAEMPARVVINQRNGTIVIGERVRLSRVVFANDNLIVTTSENPTVSQPNPLSGGNTTVVPRTQITAVEQGGNYNLLSEGIEVRELAEALNAMGVSPQDLITIFQSLKSSGALHAELIIQ